MKGRTKETRKENVKKISRRKFLKQTAFAAGGLATIKMGWGTPNVIASPVEVTVIGTGVTLIGNIRTKAEKDLGFKVTYQALDGISALQKAISQPAQFQVYDQWFDSIDLIWPSGAVQAIDTNRIKEWDKVSPLTKEGKLTPDSKYGDGDAPYRKLYVDKSTNRITMEKSRYITMLPMTHNADSLGYRPDIVPKLESWAGLFDPKWKGKVMLLNDPRIGTQDAAMGAEALGVVKFKDKGNMSREEIDKLMSFLIKKKHEGQFRAFWSSFGESVNLVVSGEVVLGSMWSPAVTAIKAEGVPCKYAVLKEGYRGWHGGCCISSRAKGKTLDATYEYLNWWMDGWAGAFVARQGYYFSIPKNVKKYLSKAEWDFWYEGKPAAVDIKDPFGTTIEKKGAIRDGGSYWTRFKNIATWNSVMDENDYLMRKWNEFLAA